MATIVIRLKSLFQNYLRQNELLHFISDKAVYNIKKAAVSCRDIKIMPNKSITNQEDKQKPGCDKPTKTMIRKGKTTVITGATSGIGKEFAQRYAALGYDLVITGRRREIINQIASEIIKKYKVEVKVVIVDLAVKKEVEELLKVIDKQNNIEVLINNAGFGQPDLFNKNQLSNQLKMIDVHVTAPVLLINKVLPHMIAEGKGIIINVTSLAAYTPTPFNAMYTSSKSFLTNYTESLSMQLFRYGIQVQCLCPGFTHTDFHKRIDIHSEPNGTIFINLMEPTEVVNYSFECLTKGKIICVPGASNRFLVHLISIVPRRMYYFFTNHLTYRNNLNEKRNQYA